jgi:hypothetical protein
MRLAVPVGKAVEIFQTDFGHLPRMILSKLLLLSSGMSFSSGALRCRITATSPIFTSTLGTPAFLAAAITVWHRVAVLVPVYRS